jgi:hypothetical protein
MNLGEFIREEREKLRRLPFREKIEYIWDYYKLWIIGISFFLIFGTYLLTRIAAGAPEYRLYVTMVGTRADLGTGSPMWSEFLDYSGFGEDVEFNAESYFDFERDRGRGNSYYEVFTAVVDAGILDAVTMTPSALALYGETGRLMDLSRQECAEIAEKYGDRLIYSTPIDEEYSSEPVPVGIDVSDSLLMTKYGIYAEDEGCALGIGANSRNIDAVGVFLDYILGGDGSDA